MFSTKDLRDLKKMDKDDVLDLLGLETRKGPADWLLPTLGAFSVGMLVGAGLGLLMAPKPGAELRDDLRNRLQGGEALSNGTGQQRPESVTRGA
jgi:hypothetical protein